MHYTVLMLTLLVIEMGAKGALPQTVLPNLCEFDSHLLTTGELTKGVLPFRARST